MGQGEVSPRRPLIEVYTGVVVVATILVVSSVAGWRHYWPTKGRRLSMAGESVGMVANTVSRTGSQR